MGKPIQTNYRHAPRKGTTRHTFALKITLAAATLIILAILPGPKAHAEGAFAALYAARPPAGSAFVRVVNRCAQPLKTQIGTHLPMVLEGDKIGTDFVVLKGNTPFALQTQGQTTQMKGAAPDTFVTLVAPCDAPDGQYAVLEEPIGSDNGLKAALRFYNLISNCAEAKLLLGETGPTIFSATPAMGSESRSINPVQATLVATCGATKASLALPALTAGDHYSLFLTGTADKPRLSGQINRSAPFK